MEKAIELHEISMKKHTNNQEIYDVWSKSYDSYVLDQEYTGPNEIVSQLASMILNFNEQKIEILDFGCGTGLVGQEIKKRNLNVILDGVDISSQMLDKARIKNCYRNLHEANLMVENIFLQNNKKYQIIISCGVFLEGHAPIEVIEKLLDILYVEGFLLFTIRNSYLEQEKETFHKYLIQNQKVKILLNTEIKYLKGVRCKMFLVYRVS